MTEHVCITNSGDEQVTCDDPQCPRRNEPRKLFERRRHGVLEQKKDQARELRRVRRMGGLDAEDLELIREIEATRPKTRADCGAVQRPCHFLSCKYNLALDLTSAGSIQTYELDDLEESCALDVADRGGITLEEVGSLIGVTRERVRQIEERAAKRLSVKLEEVAA